MKEKDLSFEEAIEELEKVVGELETGDLPLEKSVTNFKKGMELSNYCSKLLDQRDGTIREENFEAE